MSLSFHLVSTQPTPIFLGALPRDYAESPAEIVVNLCGYMPRGRAHMPTLFMLPIDDSMGLATLPDQDTIESFLKSVHVFAQHKPSYWHCQAGINRSGLLLATYLHLYRGMRISEAISTLRARRSDMVLCNSDFERLLRERYGEADEKSFVRTDLETYLSARNGPVDGGER